MVRAPWHLKRLHVPTWSSFISTPVRTVMTGRRGAVKTGVRKPVTRQWQAPRQEKVKAEPRSRDRNIWEPCRKEK